ncbi:MAG: hypothetical protein FWH27_16820 [Planctomycetaceae bacterium]|nr:hypothetical protein [Planctomycetaceae bacterium]
MKHLHLALLPLLLFAFFVCATISGCRDASRPADLPTLYPCILTFQQEGKPLVGAVISLEPAGKSSKWAVTSITDESGVARVVTHGKYPGAPEGDYAIVIYKEENEQEKTNRTTVDDLGNEVEVGGMISTYSCVEKDYTDPATSPLKITITKGKNEQNFECGKAVRVLLRKVAP